MRCIMICNPAAGGGSAARRLPELVRRVRRAHADTQVTTPRDGEEAARVARAAARSSADLVVAVGGDGTAHQVVNGLLAAGPFPPTLLHLPVGTGCDFARSLGLRGPAERLARGIARAPARWIDVGCLDVGAGAARRWFVNGVNVGLGAGIVRRLRGNSTLARCGRYAYLLAAGAELLRARPLLLTLQDTDGQGEQVPLLHLAICNGRYVGGGMQVPGEARLDSGRLVVTRVAPMRRLQGVLQLRRAMLGRAEHPAIRSNNVTEIAVKGAAGGFEVDGELGTAPDFRASVRPRALRVLMPAPN